MVATAFGTATDGKEEMPSSTKPCIHAGFDSIDSKDSISRTLWDGYMNAPRDGKDSKDSISGGSVGIDKV